MTNNNTISFSDALEFIEKINTATVSPEEISETFERVVSSKEEMIELLGSRKFSKKDLLNHAGFHMSLSNSKPEIVESVYSNLLASFACGAVSHTMFEETFEIGARRAVALWTEEKLEEYAEKIAKTRKEREERAREFAQAVKDPQTLEQFHDCFKITPLEKLTYEKRALFYSLKAKELKAHLANERKEKFTAQSVDDCPLTEIQETVHGQKGHDLFVVQLIARVERDKFTALNQRAKLLGGYYSMTAERQTNTHKRAREAAYAQAEARKSVANAETLEKIAESISRGEAGFLDQVQHKVDLFTLESILYVTKSRSVYAQNESDKSRPVLVSDLEHLEFPWPSIHRENLLSICEEVQFKEGFKMLSKRILKHAKTCEGHQVEFKGSLIPDFKKLLLGSDSWTAEFALESIATHARLVRLELHSPSLLHEGLKALISLRSNAKPETELAKKERALVGSKIPGFFPTPPALIERMIDVAQLPEDGTALEPSAGKGDIAEALKVENMEVFCYEINHSLREILELNDYNVIGHDFFETLENEEDENRKYDAVLMNPPFEKGVDAAHVCKAYLKLKETGVLVAIMSRGTFTRSDKAASAFRDWLENLDAEVTTEELPEGSFQGAEAFRQTGVSSNLLIIRK